MQVVEASAATREQAIENALKELGVELYEVDDIQILDEGSRGFLGFGARPVCVKVTVEKLADKPKRGESGRDRGRRGRDDRPSQARDKKDRREDKAQADADRPPKQQEGRGKPRRGQGQGQNRQKQQRNGEQQGRGEQEPRRDKRPKPQAKRETRQERKPEAAKPEPVQPDIDIPEGNGEDEAFTAITDEQGKEAAALLEAIIGKMEIKAAVEFSRGGDEAARLNVESEDGAILIGRKGRTLSAMQYLINRMISRGDEAENTERLVVDVEGYIERRRATLEDMAKTFARRAKDDRRNMRLKPLSPQERRIIHVTLQDDPDVRTFSLGESLYRSVVISPKDAKPERGGRPQRGRGQRGRGRGGRNRGPRNAPQSQRDDVDAGQFGD